MPSLPVNTTVAQAFIALLTFVSPNILAFISHPDLSALKKGLLYVVSSIVISVGYLLSTNGFDLTNLTVTASALFVLSVSAYLGAWKPFADKVQTTKGLFKNASTKVGSSPKSAAKVKYPMDNMYR